MSSAGTRRLRLLRSIGFQLNAWYVAVFIGSLVLLALLGNYRITASIESKDREVVNAKLKEYKARFDERGLDGFTEMFSDPEQLRQDPFFVRISDSLNQTLFLHVPDRDPSFDGRTAAVQVGEDRRRWLRVRAGPGGGTWHIGAAPLAGGLWLQVGRSDERAEELLGHLRTGFAAVIGIALIFGLLGGAQLTSQALRPIQKLAEAIRSIIRSGDFLARVPPRGTRDEMDELIQLFNRMLDKNQALIQGMREALDNVAHDLRTPLTRLRAGAELALREGGSADQVREALMDCIEESDRVLTMLQTLMDISEAETGVMKLERQTVDLSDVVGEIVELYAHVALERGISLSTHVQPGLRVSADRNRLRQVVGNLLDNALKYTPRGGVVTIETAPVPGDQPQAEVGVHDNGVGIAPEDQPKIWQRLYRADKSRSQRGLGLGLSFVKAIVEAHGGKVEVKSQLEHGCTFTVRLPLLSA